MKFDFKELKNNFSKKEKSTKNDKYNKKSKLIEILKKDYKWENYLFLGISIITLLLGILLLCNIIVINEDAWLIGKIPLAFSIILTVLGALTLMYSLYPFVKVMIPEFKKIEWLKSSEYLNNLSRVFLFIIIMALLLFVYETAITGILRSILG